MFLFVSACRGANIDEQVEIHCNNADELKNRLSNVLRGFDGVNAFAKKAQFTNSIKTAFYKVDSSRNYLKDDRKDVFRAFRLTTKFIKSTKNIDGSFDLKYCTVTATDEIKFDRCPWSVSKCGLFRQPEYDHFSPFVFNDNDDQKILFYPVYSFRELIAPNIYPKPRSLSGQEIQQCVNSLVKVTNDQKAKVNWLN